MVSLRAVIGVVALLFATLSAADSAVDQEQAALEHFAADLKEMQVSTQQQVDFTLRNEDFSYLKQSQPLASPLEAPSLRCSRSITWVRPRRSHGCRRRCASCLQQRPQPIS